MSRHHLSVAAIVAAIAGTQSTARASEADRLGSELQDLEQRADGLDQSIAQASKAASVAPEHRLVDAQTLLALKDYDRAAILLFDIVERHAGSTVDEEATWLLGEALFFKGDVRSARNYYLKIALRPQSRWYVQSLGRLVELALGGGDDAAAGAEVADVFQKLSAVPPAQVDPAVSYVRGKYLFAQGRSDDAIAAFSAVPAGHAMYVQARYFVGASQVQKKDAKGASQTFQALLQVAPKDDDGKRVLTLTHLALGRLALAAGDLPAATDQYRQIARDSDLFSQALYESAWVSIKSGDMNSALRSLDLLLLADPDSPLAPEVHNLEGNVLIRLGQPGKATELFSKTRELYNPAYDTTNHYLQKHAEPQPYLDALMGSSGGDPSDSLPKLAVDWVATDPRVLRGTGTVKQMAEIHETLEESAALIDRLDHALDGSAKAAIFPDLAAARAQAFEVENNLALLRDRIAKRERDLVEGAATPEERAELASIAEQRKALEQTIANLPRTRGDYEARAHGAQEDFDALDQKASELAVLIANLRAELVAMEKYFNDNPEIVAKSDPAYFKAQTDEYNSIIESLDKELGKMRADISDAAQSVGIGDPVVAHEQEVKRQHAQALARERQILRGMADRVSGPARDEALALDALQGRAEAAQSKVDTFKGRLDRKIEDRLGEVRTSLDEEKKSEAAYREEERQNGAETAVVAADVALAGFRTVDRRLYDILVQSDVGIIDVAWALKEQKTADVTRLNKDRSSELKGLDEGFQEVLEESK